MSTPTPGAAPQMAAERTSSWKLHTPNIIREVMNNKGTEALRIPLNLLVNLLGQLAGRCAEINDAKLNGLMLRMALYSAGDPEDKANYRPEMVENPPGVDAVHCVNTHADLLAALETARDTIQAWHGPGAWDDYQHSPEMKKINAALAKADAP